MPYYELSAGYHAGEAPVKDIPPKSNYVPREGDVWYPAAGSPPATSYQAGDKGQCQPPGYGDGSDLNPGMSQSLPYPGSSQVSGCPCQSVGPNPMEGNSGQYMNVNCPCPYPVATNPQENGALQQYNRPVPYVKQY